MTTSDPRDAELDAAIRNVTSGTAANAFKIIAAQYRELRDAMPRRGTWRDANAWDCHCNTSSHGDDRWNSPTVAICNYCGAVRPPAPAPAAPPAKGDSARVGTWRSDGWWDCGCERSYALTGARAPSCLRCGFTRPPAPAAAAAVAPEARRVPCTDPACTDHGPKRGAGDYHYVTAPEAASDVAAVVARMRSACEAASAGVRNEEYYRAVDPDYALAVLNAYAAAVAEIARLNEYDRTRSEYCDGVARARDASVAACDSLSRECERLRAENKRVAAELEAVKLHRDVAERAHDRALADVTLLQRMVNDRDERLERIKELTGDQ